ncbi:STAS-like domain-containing protein [Vibrio parahaemolyticus]|uniref:STAS-like domain-containing protein n=1 Tax=Vibrio parahaemolyticus TaxID=670 RepID=UPI0023619E43|nr:STAS-like domain-containing protein [Vibrio parahaemolyticus]EIF2704025.1 STAS-like domain-containing protein [Vibrio alginolyticus]ELA6983672.1 STAS-like domain-containing protein [Vibrio parahaemolyticus]MBE4121625.1 STAS-like domain-containing protein [Vibrio parahaemolyticus]HCE3688081.1 STAS-like domain-containing protein [Vibrio parahaemolyticus]
MMHKIDLAEFSEFPFGRVSPADGEYTGQKFRDTVLKPTIDNLEPGDTIDVNLDNVVVGIGSSFLSESFGGLVKKGYISKDQLLKILTITSEDKSYEMEIIKYIEEAELEEA